MPKNIFFMSFLYVFIACAMFIAATVHSKPSEEGGMAVPSLVVQEFSKGEHGHRLLLTDSVWQRR